MPSAAILCPTQEDVAGRLHEPVPLHDPLAVVGINARACKCLQYRGTSFLDLEEQGSLFAGHEQRDAANGADTADADHFDRLVLEGISVKEDPPVVRQRFEVAGENFIDLCVEFSLA